MKKPFFLLLATIPAVLACQNSQPDLTELQQCFSEAFSSRDRGELLELASAIADEDIQGEHGLEYLKLKLKALTFAGEYRTATEVLERHRESFEQNVQVQMAYGILLQSIGQSGAEPLTEAYTLLRDLPIEEKTEAQLVVEYYLSNVLGETETQYVKQTLIPELRSSAPQAIGMYDDQSGEELFRMAPLGFIATEPFSSPSSDPDARWWE